MTELPEPTQPHRRKGSVGSGSSVVPIRSRRGTDPSSRSAARDLLTIPDVCAELGVSRSTFYDWRAKRKAPPCMRLPNGDLRVRRSDLDRWLESLEDVAA